MTKSELEVSNEKCEIMLEEIIRLAAGNPGALTFLMELFVVVGPEKVLVIYGKIAVIPTLRGPNLYILWSDLCGKDMDKVFKLCKSCPNDILEDACSRQDYSGRELVKKYLEE